LFGILAFQNAFLSREALVAGMQAWLFSKARPLGEILLEQGALSGDRYALLEALVREHLKLHGDDPQKSLAVVSSLGSVHQQLEQLADSDVQASLVHVSAARLAEDDPYATRAPSLTHPRASTTRFRILRPHARGGLGEVYVAEDQELHREVALKEIQNRHADDSQSRARFLLEAEVTGGLEHPGIVPVYGLGHYADGRPFYAMRFIKGDSLQEAIDRFHQADGPGRDPRERNLALHDLLGRLVDVCNAVAYAHARGVLHRDLKPGNVMLGRYGETLVVDWGLAKPLGRADAGAETLEGPLQPVAGSESAPTLTGQAVGTPAYMSPEQAEGRLAQLGPASDVYSLGARLYSLLTGQAPFPGQDVAAVLPRARKGDFRRPGQLKAGVPAALEAICIKAMRRRAADRYPTPQPLAQDVERWVADEPVGVYREPLGARLGRWARRHKPLVAGVASLLVTAVVLLTVGLVAVRHEQRRTEQANAALTRALAAEAQRRQQARQALDALSSQVVEDLLARQPAKDLTAEQKRFLRQALESYEAFARETGQDEASRAGVAAAIGRVGRIRYKLGEMAEAEAAYRRSAG
jgi:serine/threonine-protein kinase